MEGEKFLANNDSEINSGSDNDPWLKLKEEIANESFVEDPEVETESDSYTFEGVEYRNVDKIDIVDDKGKYEWLGKLLENGALSVGIDLNEAKNYGNSSEIAEKESQLDFIKRQQTILNRMEADNSGNILDSLRSEHHDLYTRLNDMIDNGDTSQKDIDEAFENYSATFNLLGLIESETARRDPKYFGPEGMKNILADKVKQAEQGVDKTMLNGYIDEDGLIHVAKDGERLPSVATENAKIILEEAEQDAEVFDSLMGIYGAAHDYQVPHAVKKEDFMLTINNYIEGHKNQIDRLTTELGYLAKGTAEYLEKEAEIKRQKQHQSTAIRLITTYFS